MLFSAINSSAQNNTFVIQNSTMVKNTYVEDRSAVKLDTHHMASGPMGSNSVEQLY